MPDIMLSHSNDGLLDACPRKFEFSHVYKQMPPREARDSEETSAADVGTNLHEAAQEWVRSRFVHGATKQEALDAAYYTLALRWDYDGETTKRPLGAAAMMLESMALHPFWDEGWEICNIEGFGPAIEVPFQIIHDTSHLNIPKEYRFITQGKMDLAMRNRHTHETRCIDFKSTGYARNLWDTMFRYSDQGPVYSFPLQVMTGQPIGEAMRVTYFMLPFVPDEDRLEQFGEYRLPSQPLTFDYTSAMLAEMWAVKHERIARMAGYINADLWPRTTHGCMAWNRPCQYFNVCHLRDRKQLADWFKFEEWDSQSRIYKPVWVFQESHGRME